MNASRVEWGIIANDKFLRLTSLEVLSINPFCHLPNTKEQIDHSEIRIECSLPYVYLTDGKSLWERMFLWHLGRTKKPFDIFAFNGLEIFCVEKIVSFGYNAVAGDVVSVSLSLNASKTNKRIEHSHLCKNNQVATWTGSCVRINSFAPSSDVSSFSFMSNPKEIGGEIVLFSSARKYFNTPVWLFIGQGRECYTKPEFAVEFVDVKLGVDEIFGPFSSTYQMKYIWRKNKNEPYDVNSSDSLKRRIFNKRTNICPVIV